MSTVPQAVPLSPDTGSEPEFRTAMRVVFPQDGDVDALPVYIDRESSGTASTLRIDDVLGRRRYRVRPGRRVSFGSYFNAFPAGYWRHWTITETVRLQVRTTGSGTLHIYKSNAAGASQQVLHVQLDGAQTRVHDLSLTTFGDGGYYWFDLVGGAEGLVLEEAAWLVPDQGRARGTVTLAVTTFNRPDYCVRTIATVADDPELRAVLDEMVVVDQGDRKVRDEGGYRTTAERMGGQLRVLDQANLGGSGGFARGMYEALARGVSDYVVLLDDDVILETESIVRMAAFADLCRRPTIIGGHMFDLNNRDALHSFGERINRATWQWGLLGPGHEDNHRFGDQGLRETAWMHERCDVDYNGWWMSLIPTSVVRQIGLALPVFIKWDDAEYSLRAAEHGVSTVSLPGACLWHVSWTDKDDLVGWQAYFHARNRMITGLMYSPFDRGAGLVPASWRADLKHLVSMQYYTASGRIMGLKDVLDGPEHLHDLLPVRLSQIRAMAADYDDSRMASGVEAFPPVRSGRAIRLTGTSKDTPRPVLLAKGAMALVRQVVMPEDESAKQQPQARIAHKDSAWYNLAQCDSAVVSSADGVGTSWYRRDRALFRRMAAESSAVHTRLAREWPELRERYRSARDEVTSVEAWGRTFGLGDGPSRPS